MCIHVYLPISFQELQNDIIDHSHLHQSVNSSADDLLKSCGEYKVVSDVSQVRNERQDLSDRWDGLRLSIKETAKANKNKQKAVAEFEERVAPVDELIVASERKLDEDSPFSWDLLDMEEYVNDLNVSATLRRYFFATLRRPIFMFLV